MIKKVLFAAALSAVSVTASAQSDEFPLVRDLNWLNEQFLIKQRNRIESLSRQKIGQGLSHGKRNIDVLQRLIDRNAIPKEDKLELQAMGVILGDIFADSHKKLAWRVYEDHDGKSHAVCVAETKHCIFPVTMLSRRIEAGLTPNVKHLYDKVMGDIKTHLPKTPYAT